MKVKIEELVRKDPLAMLGGNETQYMAASKYLGLLQNNIEAYLGAMGVEPAGVELSKKGSISLYRTSKEFVTVRSHLNEGPFSVGLEIEGPRDVLLKLAKALRNDFKNVEDLVEITE